MSHYTLEEAGAQLSADTSGNYKVWLLKTLKQHKAYYDEKSSELQTADEYNKSECMKRAIVAAIAIIESKNPDNGQDDVFNNIY